jgi:hypothetical protein
MLLYVFIFIFIFDEEKLCVFLGGGTRTLYYWNIRFVFALKAALLDRIHRTEQDSPMSACQGGFFCMESIAVFPWVNGPVESFCVH